VYPIGFIHIDLAEVWTEEGRLSVRRDRSRQQIRFCRPEQACGKVVDKRADIWAFGAVL
jgi:hypothetical protein